MRVLLLMRGAPGCGKSTYIENNGLKEFTVSADDLRLLYASPTMMPDGSYQTSQANDGAVWKTLKEIVENRMKNGWFTVIDSCNSKTQEITNMRKLAQQYRYRVFCIDFTDIPLDVCIERNHMRAPYKQVPDDVLINIYSRFETQKVPAGVKVLKPHELNQIWWRTSDLNEYDRVVAIGDIHGCYTAFSELMRRLQEDGGDAKTFYVFVGDYLDRGIENGETLKAMIELSKLPNVVMLEGNHEHHLYNYSHKKNFTNSYMFFKNTRPQIEAAGIEMKEIHDFTNHLMQAFEFTFDGKYYLVSHGGISAVPGELLEVPTKQLIYGVGRYDEMPEVVAAFERSNQALDSDMKLYQIFGHRNIDGGPFLRNNYSFVLEDGVESGGNLRALAITRKGYKNYSIENTVYEIGQRDHWLNNVEQMCEEMRMSKYITEKQFDNISSFSFTKECFDSGQWDGLTTHARGLFINTDDYTVAVRSYDKFFNLDQRFETKRARLLKKLNYPCTAYKKENGFLGLVGYNTSTDELLFTSKSMIGGEYSELFKRILTNKIGSAGVDKLHQICRDEHVTFIFECISPDEDPHIIEYPEETCYLLDVAENKMKFVKWNYARLQEIAGAIGVPVKEHYATIHDAVELQEFFDKLDNDELGKIEGVVIEDMSGFMFKCKTPYYLHWKHMRGVAAGMIKHSQYSHTGSLLTPEANRFYKFMIDKAQVISTEERETLMKEYKNGHDIIKLRNEFMASQEESGC